MTTRKPRELFLCKHPSNTEGWIYDDISSAQKRLSSGLKAPPNASEYSIIHVQEVLPDTPPISSHYYVEGLWEAKREVDNWKSMAEELAEALKLSISRETPDQNHDWVTCKQPSCLLGREALAKFEKLKNG